jgi:cytochrome c oxidase subunit 2
MSFFKLSKGAVFSGLIGAMSLAGSAAARPLLGQPTPGGIGMQPPGSEVAESAAFFHNGVLLPIITIITLFVFGLIGYVILRFNKRANPVPARFSHNTPIEVVWTIAPVVILLFIAIFSYKLLFAFNDQPRPDVTLKVTGYQWYWGFELPDQGVGEVTSVMLPEAQARAQGRPYQLAVANPIGGPQGAVVKVLVTGADVIHSFGIPAFGFTVDAVPGRVNETWFRAERTGTYYGQCRELCGVDHAFMPFEIRVVPRAEFARWVVANGGSMGGAPATNAALPPPAPQGQAAGAPTTAPQPGVAAAAGNAPPPAPAAAPVSPAGANPTGPNPAGGDPRPNASAPSAPAAGAQAPAQR